MKKNPAIIKIKKSDNNELKEFNFDLIKIKKSYRKIKKLIIRQIYIKKDTFDQNLKQKALFQAI